MATAASVAAIHIHRFVETDCLVYRVTLLPVSLNASSAKAKSCAEWKRCSGSFSRQRWTTRCIPGGVAGASCEMDEGSSFRIAAMVSAEVDLRKGCLPV